MTEQNRNRDDWDDYGCTSENQLVLEEVVQALAQDADSQTESPNANEPQAEQPWPIQENMPVAPLQNRQTG